MKTTTIRVTKGNREKLQELQEYIEETRNLSSPTPNDALAHLLAFWEQKREDKDKRSQGPDNIESSPSAN